MASSDVANNVWQAVGTGFVSPSEARLALAQCGVALSAAEALVLADVLAAGGGGTASTRSQWAVTELLGLLRAAPLPNVEGGGEAVVAAWVQGAKGAVAEYLAADGADGAVSDVELLRYLVAPAAAAFHSPAVSKVVDASLARHTALAKMCAALDKNLAPSSGGSGGAGALSLTNVKYAAGTSAGKRRSPTLFTAFEALFTWGGFNPMTCPRMIDSALARGPARQGRAADGPVQTRQRAAGHFGRRVSRGAGEDDLGRLGAVH